MKHVFTTIAIFAVMCANSQTPTVVFDPIAVTTLTTGYSVGYMGPVDNAGNIYIANSNSVKRINPNGTITLLAGTGVAGLVDGPAATAQFNGPLGLALDAAGNIYVGDKNNNAIRKITPAGMVSTLAGNGTPGYVNAGGSAARFNSPTAVVADAAGNIFVSDNGNYAIRKITAAGAVSTLTINPGPAVGPIRDPNDMTIDQQGNLYMTQIYGFFLKITPAGVVSTVFPPGFYGFTEAVATDKQNNLYVPLLDAGVSFDIIFKIFPANVAAALAGSAVGYKDGIGTNAMFTRARRISLDPAGSTVYVSDFNGIRKMNKPVLKFTSNAGVASAAKNFNISGNYLAGAASLQAPAGYELSLSQAGPYSSTLGVPSSSGEVRVVQIFIRLGSANAPGTYNGVVALSASGAITQNLTVSGVVSPAGGNQAPVSNAGSNVITVLPVSSIPLDASASSDADGSIIQYYWYQVQGPVQAVIGNNFSAGTTATGLTAAGTYIFGLQVKDNAGALAYSSKTVVVSPASTIPVPDCVVGTSPGYLSTVTTQTTATLTWQAAATATSYDVYLWTGATEPTAPIANTTALTYNVSGLTASTLYNWYIAPRNAFGPATICAAGGYPTKFITAAAGPGNQPPVPIIAGSNTTITLPVSSVTLDATLSYDPDGSIVQYYWFQAQGPVQSVLADNFSSYTTATSLTTPGTYIYVLQVIDNLGVHKYAQKVVTVQAAGTRVMDASKQTILATPSLPKADKNSSLPSISAVVSPNPVATGQQAKLQINSNKAGTVIVNIVTSNGVVIGTKKVNLVTGNNNTTVNTNGLARGFHAISITGSDKPLHLKLLIQ